MTFTAIDFETATPARHSICQIGICRVENGNIIYTDSILVKPPDNDFSHWNVAVHRISPDLTENAPPFPEIWENIKPHIQKQLIIAHNIAFDIDCLLQTLAYYGLDFPDIEHDCTYKISGLNLIDLAEALEVEILNHHDAMNDSIMCANAYIKLRNGVAPDTDKITPKEAKSHFAGHENLSGSVLKPDLIHADANSPFYNKKIVFTGVMDKISREEAAKIVKSMGADIDTGITNRTQYVIVGAGAGPVKLRKIKAYNAAGSNIQMIYESEFLEMIKQRL